MSVSESMQCYLSGMKKALGRSAGELVSDGSSVRLSAVVSGGVSGLVGSRSVRDAQTVEAEGVVGVGMVWDEHQHSEVVG
jgi:hypothetical protein